MRAAWRLRLTREVGEGPFRSRREVRTTESTPWRLLIASVIAAMLGVVFSLAGFLGFVGSFRARVNALDEILLPRWDGRMAGLLVPLGIVMMLASSRALTRHPAAEKTARVAAVGALLSIAIRVVVLALVPHESLAPAAVWFCALSAAWLWFELHRALRLREARRATEDPDR